MGGRRRLLTLARLDEGRPSATGPRRPRRARRTTRRATRGARSRAAHRDDLATGHHRAATRTACARWWRTSSATPWSTRRGDGRASGVAPARRRRLLEVRDDGPGMAARGRGTGLRALLPRRPVALAPPRRAGLGLSIVGPRRGPRRLGEPRHRAGPGTTVRIQLASPQRARHRRAHDRSEPGRAQPGLTARRVEGSGLRRSRQATPSIPISSIGPGRPGRSSRPCSGPPGRGRAASCGRARRAVPPPRPRNHVQRRVDAAVAPRSQRQLEARAGRVREP